VNPEDQEQDKEHHLHIDRVTTILATYAMVSLISSTIIVLAGGQVPDILTTTMGMAIGALVSRLT